VRAISGIPDGDPGIIGDHFGRIDAWFGTIF
jgi:hypothetical protein